MRTRFIALIAVLLLINCLRQAEAGILYAIEDNTNTLVSIDPNTYAVTTVGSTGIAEGDFGDLTYNVNDGKLYWIAGRSNENLYTIDRTTGAATLIGTHGVGDLFALAFNSGDGKLYAQDSSLNVYSLDLTTAAPTSIGTNSVYPGGFEYRSDTDQLILLEAGNDRFYQIDTATGAATFLADGGLPFVNDNDVAYDSELNAYFAADHNGSLIKFDGTTFAGSIVANLVDPYAAIAFVADDTSVPEPTTLMLWGVGALGCLFSGYRRRKLTA